MRQPKYACVSPTAEMGDYDPAIHATGYLSELRFVADQSPDLEQKIQLHHVTLK